MSSAWKIPLSMQILAALLLGVIVAILLPAPGSNTTADSLVAAFEAVGQAWVAALQMTILPLIFALLANGLGGAQNRDAAGGAVAKRSFMVFGTLYVLGISVALVANLFLLKLWPVSAEVANAFARVAGETVAAEVPRPTEIFLSIIPPNIFAALAAGTMLPVVAFAILFGLAMRQIDESRRERLSEIIAGIADIMFRILAWVLKIAPLGVFALILATAHGTGAAILSAMGSYIRHVVSVSLLLIALSYLVAWIWGGKSIAAFARAAAPSQLVALSTRSSVASMPVMLRSARNLEVPEQVADVSLPLAVALFRVSGPASTFSISLFAAAASGIHPPLTILIIAATLCILMEFAAVGLPNQVNLIAISAPIFALLGAPLAVLPMLLAVDPIPDAVGTTANVSMDVAATTAIARRRRLAQSIAEPA